MSDVETFDPALLEDDIATLTRTQLKEKYKLTYSSWNNMKGRRHTCDAVIHSDFEDFGDFLSHMGPRPAADYSLDRTDPHDPEYSPAKCYWADKITQASNQRRTLKLTYQGDTKPITEWCRELGLKADTVRRRFHRGGSAEEILFGAQGASQGKGHRRSHHSVEDKWPWLTPARAKDFERDFLIEHTHGETRYAFFLDRVSIDIAVECH